MIMRASEFILDEGKASRRKQASMNALRRNANAQKTTAPAAQPTASTGTSAPAVAPTNVGNRPNPYMTPQANIPNASINPTQQAQPTQPTQPASSGTDWNALNQATAPAPSTATVKPSVGSSMMSTLKQKAMSAGKGIANKFGTQGKISARTDQIFMDKFLKDMATAEQTSTGLRGEPFDVKTWVGKYLAQNKWDAGDQQVPLDKAVAANYKPGIAKAMAAIGKYNNLGSTIKAKAANATSAGVMGQMANTLASAGGSGTSSTVNVANPNNPNQAYATKSGATQPTPAVQVSLGGTPGQPNTLNPADPVDAKILSMLKQQGKI